MEKEPVDCLTFRTATGDHVLDFVGYASTTSIKTLTISGDFVAFDGLQANAGSSAVPEPGSIALLVSVGMTGAGFLARR